jgi:fatty-acyl-CoA synthase
MRADRNHNRQRSIRPLSLVPADASQSHTNIAQLLETSAAVWPDHEAVIDGKSRLTYRELQDTVSRLSTHFQAAGITIGTPVGVIGGGSWETLATTYAVLGLGATLVSMNPAWERRELTYVMQHAAVEVLIAPSAVPGHDIRGRLSSIGVPLGGVAEVSRLPELRLVVPLDEGSDSVTARALRGAGNKLSPAHAEILSYTAKYGGFLRGIRMDLQAALRCAEFLGDRLKVSADDRHLNLLPLTHPAGLVDVALTMHQRGATIVLVPSFNVDQCIELAYRERCSITGGSAVLVGRVLKAGHERVVRGGPPLPIRRFWSAPTLRSPWLAASGIEQYACYGLTEASNLVTVSECPISTVESSHGTPLPGVLVRIADPVTGESLPSGEIGEICFQGWNLALGYQRAPRYLTERIDCNGYFHTGDFGYLGAAGALTYLENRVSCIRTGGELVSEAEVERIIECECEGVVRASVVGLPDPVWGDLIVAFLETEHDIEVSLDDVRSKCATQLARFKLPRTLIDIGTQAWPRTPDGRVDKCRLRDLAQVMLAVGVANVRHTGKLPNAVTA